MIIRLTDVTWLYFPLNLSRKLWRITRHPLQGVAEMSTDSGNVIRNYSRDNSWRNDGRSAPLLGFWQRIKIFARATWFPQIFIWTSDVLDIKYLAARALKSPILSRTNFILIRAAKPRSREDIFNSGILSTECGSSIKLSRNRIIYFSLKLTYSHMWDTFLNILNVTFPLSV